MEFVFKQCIFFKAFHLELLAFQGVVENKQNCMKNIIKWF